MMLTPGEHPQLIITHMDDSETVIELNDMDAYSWQATTHGLVIRRVTGRTTFPWQTVKSHTIIPAQDNYHPSDLPTPAAIDLDASAFQHRVWNNTDHALDYSRVVDTIRRAQQSQPKSLIDAIEHLRAAASRSVFGDDPTVEQS
jgi:hypothetical protein